MSKKKWAAVIGGLIMIGMIAGAVLLMMGPSSEELNIMNAINNQKRVIDHKGHVNKVILEKKDHDGVMPFEAKILNESGVSIGTVKGRRIEGLGTAGLWYAFEGEPPDPERQHHGHHRDGQQGPGGPPDQQGSHDHGGQDKPPNPDTPK